MKKLTIIIVLIICSTQMIFAQKKATIKFTTIEHDYGMIKEDGGKQECMFNFTNTGNDTLKLVTVKPGCGCTTSEWTKGPILSGKQGFVKAVYDPMNRPGKFSKIVTVNTNDPDHPTIILTIKGEVTPKIKTKADVYMQKMGSIRFKSNHIAFNDLVYNASKTDTLWYYNNSNLTLNVSFKDVPVFITVKADPIIKPEQEAFMLVTYDATKRNDWGLVFDFFTMVTNDTVMPEKRINASAQIVEDFSKYTPEDLKNAPKIKFVNLKYDFGTVKEGEEVKYKYVFVNDGQSDLLIRKTRASCGCTATNPEKTLLKKGEESYINATFNSTGRKGAQHKTITVVCNDPTKPTVTLEISGNVIDKNTPETPPQEQPKK